MFSRFFLFGTVLAWFGSVATAQDWDPSYNLFGGVGLVEMPTADMAPDGRVAMSVGGFSQQQRTTLTFQITPKLSGSFRYSHIDPFWRSSYIYDRSFDIKYQLFEESQYFPALSVGLRDFIGTGLYTSEYLVATKGISDQLRVTGGIGWGRLGTRNGFSNPLGLDVRPPNDFGFGGTLATDVLFRGDAAFFGGVEWRPNQDWSIKLEYSSDAYVNETNAGNLVQATPFNFGVTYAPTENYRLSAAYLYGREIGFSASIVLDPKSGLAPSGLEPAPIPVAARPLHALNDTTWSREILPERVVEETIYSVLTHEGIRLQDVTLGDREIVLRYENTRYRSEAQAAGRIARILTHSLPWSVEEFVLIPMRNGVPLSKISLSRSDVEALENEPGAAQSIYERSSIDEAGNALQDGRDMPTPAFAWGLSPYLELTIFDSSSPVRGDLGVELAARYNLRPNIRIDGLIRKRLLGNRDEIGRISPSNAEPVRRFAPYYASEGDPGIEHLTISWFAKPMNNVYSRVSAGYLERMFGGISSELLWKPVDSNFALGAELNYVGQRDFDMLFGFQGYEVATGHVSAYYKFQNGFHAQVDVGRYLAGDWGATVSLDREFDNGWRVGAYATLTDMPFDDFGEGSFDKGIRLTVPFDWTIGQASRRNFDVNLSSLTRDGGARLNLNDRLYEFVRDGHISEMNDGWGRFWR